MPVPQLLRLERVEVDGLFGIYNHQIQLKLGERVTLLHGPNGVGKTIVLRMIDAMLKARFDYFRTIPFEKFVLAFDDSSTVILTRTNNFNEKDATHELRLITVAEEYSSEISLDVSEVEKIAAKIDYLHRHESTPDTWIDTRDGEVLDASEVISRYGSPHHHEFDVDEETPWYREEMPWFNNFLRIANAHLIEAQRLVQVDWKSQSRYAYRARRRSPSTIATVFERSQEFRKRLDDTMAQYGRQSQTMDQSFPQRLISATDSYTEENLQEKMAALDDKTTELIAIGILDESPTHPFEIENLRNIDPTQARVMTLYVRDTEKKLEALEELASRTRLLLDNVNQKYRHKKIRLDREEGLVAESDMGQLLPLNSLSSGEQHELVLHYDLLFRVPANTIVLIDEPELSLHVAWQKRFLPDLLRIVNLTDLDALVATHSPFIIGDKSDLMIGLGDEM